MSNKDQFYSTGPWKRVRLAVLERDNYLCKIRGSGCTLKADQVDHIIPRSKGGAALDPWNLRGACRHCNRQRVGGTVIVNGEVLNKEYPGPSRKW